MSKEKETLGRFKKQCMVVLLAAGLFLGATGSAKAIDFKAQGEWLVGFGAGDDSLISKMNDKGEREPMDVAVGQTVLYAKYAGTDVKMDGNEYKILSIKDALAIIE